MATTDIGSHSALHNRSPSPTSRRHVHQSYHRHTNDSHTNESPAFVFQTNALTPANLALPGGRLRSKTGPIDPLLAAIGPETVLNLPPGMHRNPQLNPSLGLSPYNTSRNGSKSALIPSLSRKDIHVTSGMWRQRQ